MFGTQASQVRILSPELFEEIMISGPDYVQCDCGAKTKIGATHVCNG